MNRKFEDYIEKVKQGEQIFKRIFKASELNWEDSFVLVLTDNRECIFYGAKYLKDFIESHHKRNVYVLLDQEQYIECFTEAGGKILKCDKCELDYLMNYLRVFHRKTVPETRIIFLREKSEYGLSVEEFLKKKEFSLEEFVAISLYQLQNVRKEI